MRAVGTRVRKNRNTHTRISLASPPMTAHPPTEIITLILKAISNTFSFQLERAHAHTHTHHVHACMCVCACLSHIPANRTGRRRKSRVAAAQACIAVIIHARTLALCTHVSAVHVQRQLIGTTDNTKKTRQIPNAEQGFSINIA